MTTQASATTMRAGGGTGSRRDSRRGPGRISIGMRVLAGLLVPTLIAAGLAILLTSAAWDRYSAAYETRARLGTVTTPMRIAERLSVERTYAVAFLGSRGLRFGTAYETAQEASDAGLAALPARDTHGVSGDALREELTRLRKAASSGGVTTLEILDGYTRALRPFTTDMQAVTASTTGARLVPELMAYRNMAAATEAMGIAHAAGIWGFGTGQDAFDPIAYRAFASATALGDRLLSDAAYFATPELRAIQADWESGPAVQEIARLKDAAARGLGSDTMDGVTGADWDTAMTTALEGLVALQRSFLEAADAEMAKRMGRAAGGIAVDVTLIVFTLLSALLVWLMTRRTVSRPIEKVARAMRKLSRGDMEIDLPDLRQHGAEIGDLVGATHRFHQALLERERLRDEASRGARTDQARRARVEHAIADFRSEIRATLADVAEQLDGMGRANAILSDVTARNQEAAEGTDSAAVRASTDIEAASRTADGLLNSASRIDDEVGRAVAAVEGASRAAGGSQARMATLTRATDEVGKIVTLINDIAEQTNLLALNATIEAVRAGDAGRGFVVVASEVKNLASQTASATEEITRQITGIQSAVGEVAASMGAITAQMRQADDGATAIATALEEQRRGMSEIDTKMQDVRREAGNVSSHAEGMTQTAQTARDAATSVAEASRSLRARASDLERAVEGFLTEVAA